MVTLQKPPIAAGEKTEAVDTAEWENGQQMCMDDVAVSLRGLTKSFGPVRAVDALSLEIRPGETVALLGPNGAGKTTTISMLLGLLAPDSGSVSVLGMPPSAAIHSGRVGAMLQEGSLMSGVRVGELLDYVLSLRASPKRLPGAADHTLGRRRLVEIAGLSGLEGHRVDRLSGGQTQRARFAIAIASEPDLLVLDEPTAAMDVEARHEFWATMREYTSAGRTVLFATHYLEEAEAFASRVVIIAHGRIVAGGTVDALKQRFGAHTVRFRAQDDGQVCGGPFEALARLAGVSQVERQVERVALTTEDSDATVRALVSSSIAWRDLDVRSANLDDIFLAIIGNGERGHNGQ